MSIWITLLWNLAPHGDASMLLGVSVYSCHRQLWNLPNHLVNTVGSESQICCVMLSVHRTFPIHTMTPIWIFPGYPLLLMAPLASNLIDALPNAEAAARISSSAIALSSICIQGTGFLVSLMIYSAFIYRLMTQKLPRETTRPGMVKFCHIFRGLC